MALELSRRPSAESASALVSVCDLFLHKSSSSAVTAARLLSAFLHDENKEVSTAANRMLGEINLNDPNCTITPSKLADNLRRLAKLGATFNKVPDEEMEALAVAYLTYPGESSEHRVAKFLEGCVKALPDGAHIVRSTRGDLLASSCVFSVTNYSQSSKTHKDGSIYSSERRRKGLGLAIHESAVFDVFSFDGNRILGSLQVDYRYKMLHSKKNCLVTLHSPEVLVRVLGYGNAVDKHSTVCELKNPESCKKFYVSVDGVAPVTGEFDTSLITYNSSAINYSKSFLKERVLGECRDSSSLSLQLMSLLTSVSKDSVSVQHSYARTVVPDPQPVSSMVGYEVENRSVYSAGSTQACVFLKYLVSRPKTKKRSAKTSTISNIKMYIKVGVFDYKSMVEFLSTPNYTMYKGDFCEYALEESFDIDHGSSELWREADNNRVERLVEGATCLEGEMGSKYFCIGKKQTTDTISSWKGSFRALTDTGIDHAALLSFLHNVLRDRDGLVFPLKQVEHCISYASTVNDWTVSDRVTAVNSVNVAGTLHEVEEHFLFEPEGATDMFLHVCASYRIGKYKHMGDKQCASLCDMVLGVRSAPRTFKGMKDTLPGSMSALGFTQYNIGEVDVVVDCAKFREAVNAMDVAHISPDYISSSVTAEVAGDSGSCHVGTYPSLTIGILNEQLGVYLSKASSSLDGIWRVIGNPLSSTTDFSSIEEGVDHLHQMLTTGKLSVDTAGTTAERENPNFVPSLEALGGRFSSLRHIGQTVKSENSETIEKRLVCLGTLRTLLDNDLHIAALEAIANIASTMRHRDLVLYAFEELRETMCDEWCNVRAVDARMHVSLLSARENGTGSIKLEQHFTVLPEAWWVKCGNVGSNSVENMVLSVSCIVDILEEQGEEVTLQFRNVTMYSKAPGESKFDVVRTGHNASEMSGQRYPVASEAILSTSEQHFGYKYVINDRGDFYDIHDISISTSEGRPEIIVAGERIILSNTALVVALSKYIKNYGLGNLLVGSNHTAISSVTPVPSYLVDRESADSLIALNSRVTNPTESVAECDVNKFLEEKAKGNGGTLSVPGTVDAVIDIREEQSKRIEAFMRTYFQDSGLKVDLTLGGSSRANEKTIYERFPFSLGTSTLELRVKCFVPNPESGALQKVGEASVSFDLSSHYILGPRYVTLSGVEIGSPEKEEGELAAEVDDCDKVQKGHKTRKGIPGTFLYRIGQALSGQEIDALVRGDPAMLLTADSEIRAHSTELLCALFKDGALSKDGVRQTHGIKSLAALATHGRLKYGCIELGTSKLSADFNPKDKSKLTVRYSSSALASCGDALKDVKVNMEFLVHLCRSLGSDGVVYVVQDYSFEIHSKNEAFLRAIDENYTPESKVGFHKNESISAAFLGRQLSKNLEEYLQETKRGFFRKFFTKVVNAIASVLTWIALLICFPCAFASKKFRGGSATAKTSSTALGTDSVPVADSNITPIRAEADEHEIATVSSRQRATEAEVAAEIEGSKLDANTAGPSGIIGDSVYVESVGKAEASKSSSAQI